MTVRVMAGPDAGSQDIDGEELFTDYEQRLFTRVVSIAEREGRTAKLLVVPGSNAFDAIAQAAVRLQTREIVMGESAKMTAADQTERLGEAWDRTPHPADLGTRLVVYTREGRAHSYALGAHAPELSLDDIDRIHRLWLEGVKAVGPELHHRDIVTAALRSFEHTLEGPERDGAVTELRQQIGGS
jgi:hypothetical protein